MPASQADTGYGGKFHRESDDSPSVYVEVAEVLSITPPQLSREEVDVTHLQSPNEYNEYRPGMKDGGSPTISMAFLPANATNVNMLADFEDGTLRNYKITYPDTSTWIFEAFISGYTPGEIANNERITAEVTFRINGKPTLAPVS